MRQRRRGKVYSRLSTNPNIDASLLMERVQTLKHKRDVLKP